MDDGDAEARGDAQRDARATYRRSLSTMRARDSAFTDAEWGGGRPR